ncbi:hypothetical protein [Deinococcus yavapaiensis]|uniref:AAA ATPase-like protein n=1 Tax=Deinococcus yavapaiensis KR-236 TaxID=694435 RepID=A0A318SB76_9DEIO|nr:hypothetical protein [Deinococcus yavapaiensis]PYE56680.1 hypothetical protein DES52_101485 [Deinococcus yavapaiensis KR-236]
MHRPNWLELLDPLRARGTASLRFLERAMSERGANPHAVRNLVYRGVGSDRDRKVLFDVIRVLYREEGLPEPSAPSEHDPPSELSLLGREKRRAYRQFMAALRAGRTARLVVTGKPGTGKTLLLETIQRDLARVRGAPTVTRLLLSAEVAPALLALGGTSLQRLHPGLPFSVQAELQAAAAREVRANFRGVVLLRVTSGVLQGTPPRDSNGSATSLGAWVGRHLFANVADDVSLLLALEDPADVPTNVRCDVVALKTPQAAEARRFLLERTALGPREADDVVRAAGRNLDRLALLAAVHGLQGSTDDVAVRRILADSDVRALLTALAATLGEGETSVRRDVLEGALDAPIGRLPPHARALLQEVSVDEPRPVSRELLPAVADFLDAAEVRAAHARAACVYARLEREGHASASGQRLRHLIGAQAWSDVAAFMSEHEGRADLVAGVWTSVRGAAESADVERLARAVVGGYVALGRYDHPDAHEALRVLLESQDVETRAWARLKLAESAVDRGAFDAAAAQLGTADVRTVLSSDVTSGELQADAALVRAALARWRGDASGAAAACEDALSAASGAQLGRAHLWRGLVAKDGGRWDDALRDLTVVTASDPLLRARARYQEGDLRLRLGQAVAAERALTEALDVLMREDAPPEECARVGARLATALRRLGRVTQAHERLHASLALLRDADAVLTARVLSESVPVHLALGQPDEGLRVASEALAWLDRPTDRLAEAAYRTRRTRYRVALAYLTRGLRLPYLPPLPGATADNADLKIARRLFDEVLSTPAASADRERILRFDAHLSRALAEPDVYLAAESVDEALVLADHPYAEVQARAARAEVRLRAGQVQGALSDVNRAHALLRRVAADGPPDPAVWATLLALESRALLADGAAPAETLRWLLDALNDVLLAPFRDGVLREAGRSLEDLGENIAERTLQELGVPCHLRDFRASDALRRLSAREP